MIGRIRYPHLVNLYLRGRKPIGYLLWSVGIMGMIYLFRLQSALLISFGGFALSGFVRWFFNRLASWRRTLAGAEPPILSVTPPTEADV